MGDVRSGRSLPDKLGFLREEGEWPFPDWNVFQKGGANRVVYPVVGCTLNAPIFPSYSSDRAYRTKLHPKASRSF
jgi:hypothetical protein